LLLFFFGRNCLKADGIAPCIHRNANPGPNLSDPQFQTVLFPTPDNANKMTGLKFSRASRYLKYCSTWETERWF